MQRINNRTKRAYWTIAACYSWDKGKFQGLFSGSQHDCIRSSPWNGSYQYYAIFTFVQKMQVNSSQHRFLPGSYLAGRKGGNITTVGYLRWVRKTLHSFLSGKGSLNSAACLIMQTLRETRRDFRNTPNHSKTRHIVVCTRAFCWKEALFLCLYLHYVIIGLSCNCFFPWYDRDAGFSYVHERKRA